jgi:hypothetical protein
MLGEENHLAVDLAPTRGRALSRSIGFGHPMPTDPNGDCND